MNRYFILCIALFCSLFISAQNILVDANIYSPQQLIEDILINSGCIQNIQVNNTVGGNFNGTDQSYGFFTANGSGFPFASGIVMSTGRLNNVSGPNNTLSDDDAPNWEGDQDLETALGITNTTNATIIEFDFVPNADNIRFRYIFASEEYQEGSPNTCRFSDAFAFLIKPIGGEYINIALVPGTNTPVLVTTVHSGIPNACPPINETYFEGYNGVDVPINFNGQTKILAAETAVIPNQAYHIKLVIADEQNFRFDSAVFLEAESFTISANLGPDRSFVTNNPLCENEQYILNATPLGNIPLSYTWFKDGIIIPGEITAFLTVIDAGNYSVALDYGSDCIATDSVLIEYSPLPIVANSDLFQCEPTANGIATFNLYDSTEAVTLGSANVRLENFFNNENDAQNDVNAIPNPTNYLNTTTNEIVYARVISAFNCVSVAEVTLKTTTNMLLPYDLVACSDPTDPNFAIFDLNEVSALIEADLGGTFTISYYETFDNAIAATNALPLLLTNTEAGFQTIFARISGSLGCVGIAEINLIVAPKPQFSENTPVFYCLNIFPETITLNAGVTNPTATTSYMWSTGETTATIEINVPNTYIVTVTETTTVNNETFSCSATQEIVVIASETAQFTFEITGPYGNQTLIITAIGTGNYEYALDDDDFGYFQNSTVFENILGGVHTIYVRDKNGCGVVSQQIYVLDFPKFFTPNGDGIHDLWQVSGLNSDSLQIKKVEIYNRFSKLIFDLKPNSAGWNGTYNGNPLPSSDYWFKAYLSDGGVFSSHFTLKR